MSPTRSTAPSDTEPIETVRVATADRSVVDYRLENARLRLQVAVLERELDRTDRTQQALIDHYEALLSEREADLADARARLREADGPSRLDRLLRYCG